MVATSSGVSPVALLSQPGGDGPAEVATPLASAVPADPATRDVVSPVTSSLQAGGDGHTAPVTHSRSAVPALLLLEIQETHRQRQDMLRAELRLNNQIEAVYRRLTGLTAIERARLRKKASKGPDPSGSATQLLPVQPADDREVGDDPIGYDTPRDRVLPDLAHFTHMEAVAAVHTAPLVEARELLASHRKPLERRMEALARQLPVWVWVESIRGLGALGLAQIAGECGDLHHYANPAKVWKRMGLAVIDGERQRKHSDPDLAALHGYSPARRSIMYVIADSLIKNNREGEFRTYYLAEKERQRAKLPDAPRAHIHNRALRHMAKRLLRELWRHWRAAGILTPISTPPDQSPTDLAA